MVSSVEQTLEYYEETLGFTCLRTVPEKGAPDWALMKKNDVVLMFQSVKSLSKELPALDGRKPGGGMTMYFRMTGIKEFYEEVEEKVEIVSEMEHTFYGTEEFSILDINGYVLTFSEEK